MGKILIVLSAADHWMRADGTLAPAGFWAEELINMHRVLVAAGQEVDVATPGGMTPVPDPDSLNQEFVGPDAARFKAYLEALAPCLRSTLRLSDVSAATYGAVVIPGGHGPLEDLYKDPDMGRLLEEADRGETIIAAVCHGQAALLSARTQDGRWLFAGRRLTAISDEEEIECGNAENAPWLVASTLRQCGAVYERGDNWTPHIVRDGRLITGQNVDSATPLANAVLDALQGAR